MVTHIFDDLKWTLIISGRYNTLNVITFRSGIKKKKLIVCCGVFIILKANYAN